MPGERFNCHPALPRPNLGLVPGRKLFHSRFVHIVILTPVLNDWVSAQEVLGQLDAACASMPDSFSVLLVDDGSSEDVPANFARGAYTALRQVDILRLKRNLGHQRAIAIGLCHIAEKVPGDAILVMDGDGEDKPSDAMRLIDRLRELQASGSLPPIVFAERTRRSESVFFQFGYLGYRVLHYLLTGRSIRFGNFSIIPRGRLAALVVEPTLWSHYAASVAGSRLPHMTIPTQRGQRIAGRSRLNFIGLVTHGLAALSCYNELIGVRLVVLASFLFVLSLLAIFSTVTLRLATDLPLPGWTSLFAGVLVVFLLQVVTLATIVTLQIIGTRSHQPLLPIRDYGWYVTDVSNLFRRSP